MVSEDDNLGRIFDAKYTDVSSDWGGQGSGPGSDPFYNIPYRSFLENFLVQNPVSYVVDVGCGDWSFSRLVNFANVNYLGLDVAPSVISRNKKMYASETVSFEIMPAQTECSWRRSFDIERCVTASEQ